MKKNAVIFSAWFPNKERIKPYIDVLCEYYNDCDIYIGVNPSMYVEDFLNILKNTKLSYFVKITDTSILIQQHASAVQTALLLYKESNIDYNLVHFIHTKGISYIEANYRSSFEFYYLSYAKLLEEVEFFMNKNHVYGGWAEFGQLQYEWFMSKDLTSSSKDLNDTSLVINPYFDWSRFYNFQYLPLRTQWLIGMYTIRDSILKEFIRNCDKSFLTKNFLSELNSDIYVFETHIAQVVCRQGYLRYFKNFYRPYEYGKKDEEISLIKQYIIDNNLKIDYDKIR